MHTQSIPQNASRAARIAALVTAPGTIVRPTFDGHVVVVDGRTGRDACEPTADAAFDALLNEETENAS